jgi:hypothetical protein
MHFESNPHPKEEECEIDGFLSSNYEQNELVNKAILIIVACLVFRNGFSRALSGERSHLL